MSCFCIIILLHKMLPPLHTLLQRMRIRKGLIRVGPGWIALAPFWVPDDIESCNFQNLLVFGFPETSQDFMSFRQLLVLLIHGGTKGKNQKTPEICQKDAKAIQPGPTMIRPFIQNFRTLNVFGRFILIVYNSQ